MSDLPRTKAGRELLAREDYNERSFALITVEAIRAIEDEAIASLATGDSRPEPTQDQRCGICQFRFRFHASVDHPFTRPGDSRQSEGLDPERVERFRAVVERTIHAQTCTARTHKPGTATQCRFPTAEAERLIDAALAAAAPKEEPR